MKVLKDNYNDGKAVASHETIIVPRYPRKLECENCESTLEYDKSDLEVGVYGAMHVRCPLCGYLNMLDGNENDIKLTKDNIEFPTHFHHSSVETGAVESCNNENIKKEINRAIKHFRQNKDEWHWFTSYGNMFVLVNRLEGDEAYDITVTDRYWGTYIPFEPEDY